MNIKGSKAGNAYIFVLMVMMTMFLLITTVIGVTTSSRRTSGRYIQFTGLYDLALAGNERALLLLEQHVADHAYIIAEQVAQRLKEDNIENHLIYRDGNFLLRGFFLQLFKEEKNKTITDFLNDAFERSHEGHSFSYALRVTTGTYEVRTSIEPNFRGYFVRSTARKIVDTRPGTATTVHGQIEWPAFTGQIEILPTRYTWRDGPPDWIYEEDWDGPDPNTIFHASMSEADPLAFFEALGLTNIGEAEGETNDIMGILGYIKIAEFDLDIQPLDDFTPRLTGVMHVAN